MSSSVRGGWRLEVGGGECGFGLWLDYGGDMLIMLHTLLHILFNFHDRRDATKDFQFRDEIIRYPYAIRTPFHTLFFFFSGKYFIGGKWCGKGFRIIGLFPILILGYGSRQLVPVRSAMVQVR